jgi:hypothetical protein
VDTSALLTRFRHAAGDAIRPYFWSDEEVLGYMDSAYRDFIRRAGGVPDAFSEAARVPILAGEAFSPTHPSVIRFLSARRKSDDRTIRFLNFTDREAERASARTGRVWGAILGLHRHMVRWIDVPEEDDLAMLLVRRLPLDRLSRPDHEIADLDDERHLQLIDGMFALALVKRDAETFDLGRADDFAARFAASADNYRRELDSAENKPRAIAYGGL